MRQIDFSDEMAREILASDGLLALPTETVYGFGVKYDSEKAYDKLFQIKGRRPDKAVAIMCKDITNSEYLEQHFILSNGARRVVKRFLPGPLTCLLKCKDLPYQCHLGTNIAGLRIPSDEKLLSFLSALPFPIQVTSANISGQKALFTTEEVVSVFGDDERVEAIIAGKCGSGVPTTVVSLTGEKPVLIRQGAVTIEEIERTYKGEI